MEAPAMEAAPGRKTRGKHIGRTTALASSDSMTIASPLSRSRLIPRERMESACRKSPWP